LSTSVQLIRANPILSARSGNAGVAVTVTDQSKIATRDFTFGVDQLAKRQVLEFTGFNSADALVGAGTLQVEIGTWSTDINGAPVFGLNPETTVQTLTIPEGVTLSMLAETLNALPGMSAQVQNKGDGTFSLGVVSEEGAAQALLGSSSAQVRRELEMLATARRQPLTAFSYCFCELRQSP
jgi:flagellar hook-associated protein 2